MYNVRRLGAVRPRRTQDRMKIGAPSGIVSISQRARRESVRMQPRLTGLPMLHIRAREIKRDPLQRSGERS